MPASAIGEKTVNSIGSNVVGLDLITVAPRLNPELTIILNSSARSLPIFLPKTVSASSMRKTEDSSFAIDRKSADEETEVLSRLLGTR